MFLAQHGDRSRNPERGLSFQEMLVVIAVFVILAVIFFISSNQVIVKTRASRVKQDQRTLGNVLETYLADKSEYPSNAEGLRALVRVHYLNKLPEDPFIAEGNGTYVYFAFKGDEGSRPYYVLISPGPDGQIDIDPAEIAAVIPGTVIPGMPPTTPVNPSSFAGLGSSGGSGSTTPQKPVTPRSWSEILTDLKRTEYDPTNGTASRGDIIESNYR